jgi:Ca2+-binding RTX toxin-like protein
MPHRRTAGAGALVLTLGSLVAASAVASEPDPRQAVGGAPVLSQAYVYMRAQADHGPSDDEDRSILEDGFYKETFRSSSSGSHGTENAKALQDTFLTLDTTDVSPRLLQAETKGTFTSTADASNPTDGSADAYARGSLSIAIQSEGFITLVVEGTLITGHSSTAGCAEASMTLTGGSSEVFAVNQGPDCSPDLPRQTAVVEELQLAPGYTTIDLAAQAYSDSPCGATTCPASNGSASWDLTLSFCTNSFTDGPDLILGTPGRDVLCGGLGTDEIHGGDGNDLIFGGAGADDLAGGQGADIIDGEGGSDEIWGDSEDHCNSIYDGGDDLIPGPGHDVMHGCGGDDWFHPGSSLGVLAYGGTGADTFFGGNGPDYFWGGGGADKAGGGDGGDRLYGEGANDRLFGNAGGDRLYGGAGNQDYCRPGAHADDRRFNCER